MKFVIQLVMSANALRLQTGEDGLDQLKVCMSGKDELHYWTLPSTVSPGNPSVKPGVAEGAYSLTYLRVEKKFVIYGEYTHNRLAVCGKEAGSSRIPDKGKIFVARPNQLAAKVCTRVLAAFLPS